MAVTTFLAVALLAGVLALHSAWALADAEAFVRQRPPEELGCLYYAPSDDRFVVPAADRTPDARGLVLHFGAPGGVIRRVADDVVGAMHGTSE